VAPVVIFSELLDIIREAEVTSVYGYVAYKLQTLCVK